MCAADIPAAVDLGVMIRLKRETSAQHADAESALDSILSLRAPTRATYAAALVRLAGWYVPLESAIARLHALIEPVGIDWQRRRKGAGLSHDLTMLGCTDRLARGIIKGPNTGRVVLATDDPNDDDIADIGVDRQLRIDVSRDVAPASLSVWVLEPPEKPKATVFVLHGHADCKESFLPTAQAFKSAGYRAVLVDLRGHGHSSGEYLTFGVQESRDLVEVLDARLNDDHR
jgi:hypothetical protein